MADYKGLYSVNNMYRLYPVRMPLEASGGTTTDIEVGGIVYRLHTFTEGSDSFEVGFVPSSFSGGIDFLVVAGGGSGGQNNTTNANGGGGGGGVLYKEGHTLTVGSYPITVGEGGVGLEDNVIYSGNSGENSNFGDFIAIGGGGGGGSTAANNPKPGGSGGGAGRVNANPAAGVALQEDVLGATGYGNPGGTVTVNYTGAGGGGAGSAGVAGNGTAPGGNGGQGFLCSITGEEIGYAGGGGGGDNSSERAGDGYHGGGRGVGATSHYSYTTYTEEINEVTKGSGLPDAIRGSGGGGGAGSYWSSYFPKSGSGGSGIVIIRYAIGVVV